MRRVWGPPALLLVCGLVVSAGLYVSGSTAVSLAFLLFFILYAGVSSPLFFPRSTDAAEAERRAAADGRPVVFWRPGCTYCIRLRMRLGHRAGQLHWVNIWSDPEAAAAVRAVNEGNETVPTVFVANSPHTNPDPAWVREQLARPAYAAETEREERP
ncbi:glutaredoxin domain-containing protein [Streptomyces sp. NRRL F-5126]|uniref:glutaredoxin domain-containing protein n=1 Tax=Streptomyces sp. NRRL F-5126 TaxID=1463857 RepID=UPI00069123BD|nr:glutaredoxin domain-containing protein [Streptomyces sp. NRRL F-5126]